ncbi:MAG TPA: UbiA family prenyltransferase [Myxococcales bacterium]
MEQPGTVTCDLEGRVRAFDQEATKVFGYRPEEVVGKRRLQALTAGLVAVAELPGWLAAARRDGSFQTVTALRRADGRSFAAAVTLTSLADGYTATAQPLPEMAAEKALPRGLAPRLKAVFTVARVPFLTATVAPVAFAGAWAWATGIARPFPWLVFVVATVAAALLHTAANLLNDYFDWKSGADPGNNDHFAPFSGGSRSIELGLLTPKGSMLAGFGAMAAATLLGLGLALLRGWGLLAFGAVGAFVAWSYTAPPLRLAARRGLGELAVGLCFGPLMVAGAVFAMTGQHLWQAYLAGAPLGALTAAILWINEIPDLNADRAAGKTNLVVTLGAAGAAKGYVVLLALAFVSVVAGVATRAMPLWTLLALLSLPLAVRNSRIALAHYGDRQLVQANAGTIQLQLVVGMLLTVGAVVAGVWG